MLQKIPIAVTVRGGYFEAEAYLKSLEELRRSLLVPRITLTAATSGAAPGESGRVDMVVDARAFVTSSGSTAPAPSASATAGPDETAAALPRRPAVSEQER